MNRLQEAVAWDAAVPEGAAEQRGRDGEKMAMAGGRGGGNRDDGEHEGKRNQALPDVPWGNPKADGNKSAPPADRTKAAKKNPRILPSFRTERELRQMTN